MSQPISVFWFRRDLRLFDNTGLLHALKSGYPVLPLFIFDREILDKLTDPQDRRVAFIHAELAKMKAELEAMGSSLRVEVGRPAEIWESLTAEYEIEKVFTNHDYEPYARERDREMRKFLNGKGIGFFTFKDQVVFEKEEVLTGQGKPYTVFTPYSKKWKAQLTPEHLANRASEAELAQAITTDRFPMPMLESMGFESVLDEFPAKEVDPRLIQAYADQRNFPAIAGTSRLSVHLRFGTVSPRRLVKLAQPNSETWLNELIWREFYQQVLWNFPHVADRAMKPAYDNIPWRDAPEDFAAWCEGRTGYPMVDAGMRELNATGFMHNRVRMVTASFLTKHLLIDWRLGEGYFAQKLIDFDLASNNGGWQWAAGSGADAAPYFRIFNPESQLKKFDGKAKYVRQWVPEFGTPAYVAPIVDHKFARDRCLEVYKAALADWGNSPQ